MNHIKSIESFLLEALRDEWKGNLKNSTLIKNDKYFNVKWSHKLHNDIISELKDLVKSGEFEKDWISLQKETYYYYSDDKYDEDGYEIDEDDFWGNVDNINGFERFVNGGVEQDLLELYYFLSKYEKDEYLNIYRAIDVNQIWLDLFLNKQNQEVHLGEYWAYDKDMTDIYWGGLKKHRVEFHTKVLQTDINWWGTYWANLLHPEEYEINLFPNTPLELISITIDDKEVDLSNFKNKEIYA